MLKINTLSIKNAVQTYEQEYGFKLVRDGHASKLAICKDWVDKEDSILNEIDNAENIGLNHAKNGTITIDIDDEKDFEVVKTELKKVLPLPAGGKYFWEADTACSSSGRPNSGVKRWFKFPSPLLEEIIEGCSKKSNDELFKSKVLKWRNIGEDEYNEFVKDIEEEFNIKRADNVQAFNGKLKQLRNEGREIPNASGTHTVFEIRYGRHQDVLPPSLHPHGDENGDLYQYKWVNDFNIETAPADLVYLIYNWGAISEILASKDPKYWKGDVQAEVLKKINSKMSKGEKKFYKGGEDTPYYKILNKFNAEYPISQALLDNGYEESKEDDRFRKPNSHSGAGIKIDKEENRCYCFHAGDVLYDEKYNRSCFDVYNLNSWKDFHENRKLLLKEMCKLLGVELPKKDNDEKEKPKIPTEEEQQNFYESVEKAGVTVINNKSKHPTDVLKNIVKCLLIINNECSESGGQYYAFKTNAGVRLITFYGGEPEEKTLANGVEIFNVVTDKSKFYWDGGIDEKTGCYVEALPTLTDCERVIKSVTNDVLQLPTYDKISTGAFLTEDGRIISEFGSNVVGTQTRVDSKGKEYNVPYTVFMAHTIKIPEIPDFILPEHIEQAKEIVKKCYDDFYFGHEWSEEWCDSTNFHNVALMLAFCVFSTGFTNARASPIFAVSKTESGVGASFLQDVMCSQAFNLPCSLISHGAFTYVPKDDSMDVFISLLERAPVKIYDNIENGRENWHQQILLDATSGSGLISSRGYYTQGNIYGRKGTIFMVNGINLATRNEINRRMIYVSLEKPEGIDVDTHTKDRNEVLALAQSSHAELIWAFKVFYNYWVQKGKNALKPYLKGKFEHSDIYYSLLGAMLYEHYPNMLNNLVDIQQMNNKDELILDSVLNLLKEEFGDKMFLPKDVVAIIRREINPLNDYETGATDREYLSKYLYGSKLPKTGVDVDKEDVKELLNKFTGRDSISNLRLTFGKENISHNQQAYRLKQIKKE